MVYTNKKDDLSILAYHMKAFYSLEYIATDSKVIINVYPDCSVSEESWSYTYEVAMLFPVSMDANVSGHLDMLIVLNEDKHIVACSDEADWIAAFIQGKYDEKYMKVYEKKFSSIIRQLHTGVVDYVGK